MKRIDRNKERINFFSIKFKGFFPKKGIIYNSTNNLLE